MLFIQYPPCSTCKKAKKWLIDHNLNFEQRHIVQENPTSEEFKGWIQRSGYPIKKFFNTSGNVYKEQNLKEKLLTMNAEQQVLLLASNGMLVKRPLIITENVILVGFNESEWSEKLL